MLADSSIVFMFWVCDYLEGYSVIPFMPLVEDEAKPKRIEYSSEEEPIYKG